MQIGNRNWYKNIDYNFESLKNQPELQALVSLIHQGDMDALKYYQEIIDWLVESQILLKDSDLHFLNLDSLIDNLSVRAGIGDVLMRRAFAIGNEWEQLCVKIAKNKYSDILYGERSTVLSNGYIPDIIPIQKKLSYDNTGLIHYADTIIECKKSLYFAWRNQNNSYDLNYTIPTLQYKPHCRELQYWILDKRATKQIFSSNDIKSLFLEDFLNDQNLPELLKEQIINLSIESDVKRNSIADSMVSDEVHNLIKDIRNQLLRIKEFTSKVYFSNHKIELSGCTLFLRIFRTPDMSNFVKIILKRTSKKTISFDCIKVADSNYQCLDISGDYLQYFNKLKLNEIREFTLEIPKSFIGSMVLLIIEKKSIKFFYSLVPHDSID